MMLRAPIKAFFLIVIGALAVLSLLLYNLSSQCKGCESVSLIKQPEPINTLSSIVIVFVAFIELPEMPTLLPMIILLPDVEILNTQGWISPIEFDFILLLHLKSLPIINLPF